jgi:hypothetical protein
MATYRPTHGAHKNAGGDGFDPAQSVLSLSRSMKVNNFKIYVPDEPVPDGGSPAETGTEQIVRGFISKYQIGDLTLEGIRDVTIEITPVADYSGSWA